MVLTSVQIFKWFADIMDIQQVNGYWRETYKLSEQYCNEQEKLGTTREQLNNNRLFTNCSILDTRDS